MTYAYVHIYILYIINAYLDYGIITRKTKKIIKVPKQEESKDPKW